MRWLIGIAVLGLAGFTGCAPSAKYVRAVTAFAQASQKAFEAYEAEIETANEHRRQKRLYQAMTKAALTEPSEATVKVTDLRYAADEKSSYDANNIPCFDEQPAGSGAKEGGCPKNKSKGTLLSHCQLQQRRAVIKQVTRWLGLLEKLASLDSDGAAAAAQALGEATGSLAMSGGGGVTDLSGSIGSLFGAIASAAISDAIKDGLDKSIAETEADARLVIALMVQDLRIIRRERISALRNRSDFERIALNRLLKQPNVEPSEVSAQAARLVEAENALARAYHSDPDKLGRKMCEAHGKLIKLSRDDVNLKGLFESLSDFGVAAKEFYGVLAD